MARLIFNEDDHEYRVDGVVYPSVSEILRFISQEVYDNINQRTLDNAADRGSRVHAACEVLDKYRKVEYDDDLEPYMQAYVAFLKEHKPAWKGIEEARHHPGLLYAGTLDRYGEMDGQSVIIDIKTVSNINKRMIVPQLNAYSMMMDIPPTALYALHLTKDGEYKLIDIPFDNKAFMSCLTLHNHMESTRCDRYKLRIQIEKERSA